MPTYEYACTSCGHHVEVVQSFSDQPLTTCPTCQGSLRKVFGSVGFVLKGSGFYKTDSRAGSSRQDKSERSGDKEQKETAGAKEKAAGAKDAAKEATGSTGTASTGGASSAPPTSATA